MVEILIVNKTKDAAGNNHTFALTANMTVEEVEKNLAQPNFRVEGSDGGFFIISTSDISWVQVRPAEETY